MHWTRRMVVAGLLAAFLVGAVAVWAQEKWMRRPAHASFSPTLNALADGSLAVPEPTPVAESSGEVQVSDPAFLSTIRNSLLASSTVASASEAPATLARTEEVRLPVPGSPSGFPSTPLPPPVRQSTPVPPSLPSSPLLLPALPPLPGSASLAVASPPSPAIAPQAAPTAPITCPWTLLVETVEGRSHLKALRGKEVRLQVSSARLDFQSPQGCLQAQGDVQVSGAGLEGTCDRLIIAWEHDQVLLEGNVHLKCHTDGQDVELTADRLGVRLTTLAPAEAGEAVEVLPVAPKPVD